MKTSTETEGSEKIPEEQLAKIASLLEGKIAEKKAKEYASSKEVLTLLAKGSVLAFSLVVPGAIRLLDESQKERSDWRRFNLGYLKRTLARLRKQKLVKIKVQKDKTTVKISEEGKLKVLKYALEELELGKDEPWDGKWRIVIYDIPNYFNVNRDQVRRVLKKLGFLRLQESVYLTPFPCLDEVEFLRSVFHLGDHIQIIWAEKLENEEVYRNFFGV